MAVVHDPITSGANPLLKAVRKAVRRGRATDGGLAVCESPKLTREALESRARVEHILLAERAVGAHPDLAGLRETRVVDDKVFRELSSTEQSQGVMALVRLKAAEPERIYAAEGPVVILDRLSDPGNAGTIVRSAEAFGAAGIVFVESVSPFNPKTLRASAGSLFRVMFMAATAEEAIADAETAGRRIWASSAQRGTPVDKADLRSAVIVVGSEAHGVSDELMAAAEPVIIPTKKVESLNAAAAATVLFYEAARRRR